MTTRPQRYVELMRQARAKDDEAYHLRQQAKELKREMGQPFDNEIERAANDGKEIVQGCIQDP